MIYSETKLNVSDNTGAKIVKCLKVLRASKSSGAKPSSIIIASVRKIKLSKKLLKGQICRGVLIRGKKNVQRATGMSIKFADNSLILIDVKNMPLGSRIFGPVYNELKLADFSKIITLSKNII